MNPKYWKEVINQTKPCPDGQSINCCADCLADLINQLVEEWLEKAGD